MRLGCNRTHITPKLYPSCLDYDASMSFFSQDHFIMREQQWVALQRNGVQYIAVADLLLPWFRTLPNSLLNQPERKTQAMILERSAMRASSSVTGGPYGL